MVQLVCVAQRWRSGRHAVATAPLAPRKLVQLGAPVAGVGTEVGYGQLAHSCGKPHPVVAVAVFLGWSVANSPENRADYLSFDVCWPLLPSPACAFGCN